MSAPAQPILLMVEDEPAIVDLLTTMARPLGLLVESISSGSLMLDRVAALEPAIVTLDLVLEDGDGLRSLRALRARREFDEVPVLVLTALHDSPTLKAAYAAGANDFIGKPFSVDLVEARLRLYLRLYGMQRELEAERARQESMRQIARAFAHEVRNPLLAIGAAAQVAAHPEAEPRRRQRMAHAIENETQRISGLVREYVERQAPPAPSGAVDLALLCADVVELNLVGSPARGRVTVEVAPDLPSVRGDQPRLKQVLLNLLLNAAAATEEGGVIALRAALAAEASPPGVAITVADTGHGIVAADLPRIFDESFTRTGGDGLGLPIARRIVEEHGGWLHVESEPGVGSTFSVWLPIAG